MGGACGVQMADVGPTRRGGKGRQHYAGRRQAPRRSRRGPRRPGCRCWWDSQAPCQAAQGRGGEASGREGGAAQEGTASSQ